MSVRSSRGIEHPRDRPGDESLDLARRQPRFLDHHVRTIERHHRLERRHRHGALAQAERQLAADAEVALRAERRVEQFDSMPGTFTPQLRAASVYCTSRPRSAGRGYRYGAAARASAGSIPGRIGDVVFVAVDVDDALGDLEVIDGKAAAVNRPRQLHLDAAGDEEGLLVALGREAHVGECDAARQGVVAEAVRLECEVVTLDKIARKRERAIPGPWCVNGEENRHNQPDNHCGQDDEPASYPPTHYSILGRSKLEMAQMAPRT